MSTIDWVVVAGGLCAALWVNWYFFLAERGRARRATSDRTDQAT